MHLQIEAAEQSSDGDVDLRRRETIIHNRVCFHLDAAYETMNPTRRLNGLWTEKTQYVLGPNKIITNAIGFLPAYPIKAYYI